jgi:phosphatidylglycerol lysyltransferase
MTSRPEPAPSGPSAVAPRSGPTTVWRDVLRRLLPLVAPLCVALALWLLHGELARFRYADLVAYLRVFPRTTLWAAVALTAAGYFALTGYDLLAFRHLRHDLPYRRIALAGFIGYAFSNNMSAVVGGIPLRYRLYSAWGVPAAEMVRVLSLTILGFWLGFLSLCGASFTLFPRTLPVVLRLPFGTDRPLGIGCLVVVAGFLAANFLRRPSLRAGRWQLPLPGAAWSLAQIAVSALDWGLAAAVLYLALPAAPGLGFPGFLGLFLLAQAVGLLSQSPGGLGVFDTAMVLLLAPVLPAAQVLAALLVFRAVYYLLPLTVAALLLAGFELHQRREQLGQVAGTVGRWAPLVVPRVLSFLIFAAGVVLLVSGATPAVGSRLGWLNELLPLPVIEVSHFLASVAGVLLLLLARGLQRKIDAAYHLTVALLVVGIATSLLKGLDWEESSVLALMLVVLVPCRGEFYRRSALLSEPFTAEWIAAIAAVLLAVGWFGVFAHQHVEYSHELWWRFALTADAPRALRAMVGVLVVSFAVGATRLLRPAPPEPDAPTAQDLGAAAVVARAARRSYAHLALLGDKRLLFNEARSAFLMYATEGRSWIAMGDPVGADDQATELGWRFQAMADHHGGWPVFYQVEEGRLGRYVEMGLSLLKLGEEARVPLDGFSLDGPERAELRQAVRRGSREEAVFETVPREGVAALVPELELVSDAWLAAKRGGEKGFSLGWFDPDYLSRCPLALVRRRGRIVAFANLWPAGGRQELSVDLMRYDPAVAPRGVMDFLFTSLLVWAAAEGYRWFDLGMAPLAGLDERQAGPLWNRLGGFVFRHGENFYNFEGLRHFKEKFLPVWEPRYLASPAGLALPRVLTDLVSLVGGRRGGRPAADG